MSEFITADGNNLTEASRLYTDGARLVDVARAILASRYVDRAFSEQVLGAEATLCDMGKPETVDTGTMKTDDRGRPYKEVLVVSYRWKECHNRGCMTSVEWGPRYLENRDDAERRASNPPGSTYFTRVK